MWIGLFFLQIEHEQVVKWNKMWISCSSKLNLRWSWCPIQQLFFTHCWLQIHYQHQQLCHLCHHHLQTHHWMQTSSSLSCQKLLPTRCIRKLLESLIIVTLVAGKILRNQIIIHIHTVAVVTETVVIMSGRSDGILSRLWWSRNMSLIQAPHGETGKSS